MSLLGQDLAACWSAREGPDRGLGQQVGWWFDPFAFQLVNFRHRISAAHSCWAFRAGFGSGSSSGSVGTSGSVAIPGALAMQVLDFGFDICCLAHTGQQHMQLLQQERSFLNEVCSMPAG